jgi:hypothetical protein
VVKPQTPHRTTWLPPKGVTGIKNRLNHRRDSTALCTVGLAPLEHEPSTCPSDFALVLRPNSPDRIIEFLLLNPEFPHSVRYAIDHLQCALEAIQGEGGKRRGAQLTQLAGRLQASLSFGQISEILSQDVSGYLQDILRQCRDIHETIYELYVNYAIQTALAG